MTMVDGKVLVAGGQLQTANLADIVDEATQAIQPLLERRDQWIETSGLAVNELNQ